MVSFEILKHRIHNFLTNRYISWTICITIAAIVFFLNINSIPALDGDGVKYLNVADNIFKGNGITFGYDTLYPWVASPPLFPYFISLLMHTGLSSLDSANIILSFFFSGSLILVFLIACYKSSRYVGYGSLIICAVSFLMWIIATTVLVDILLTFFVLGAIFYLIRYTDSQTLTDLIVCSIFLSLAILTKNTAHLFLLATLFVVFISWGQWKNKLTRMLLVVLISITPTLIFTINLFNFVPVDFLFSPAYERPGLTQGQIIYSFISVPLDTWGINVLIKNPLTMGCILLLAIILIVLYYKSKQSLLSLLIPENKTRVLLSWIIIYYFGLMVILVRSGIPLFQRYSAVILPLVVIYITTILYQAYKNNSQKFSIILIILSVIILIVFIHGSLSESGSYYQWTKNGSGITHPEVREHVHEWINIASNPDNIIYSNDPWIVKYYSNREVLLLPYLSEVDGFPVASMDIINNTFLSFDERTYIFVFKEVYFHYGTSYESYVYYNALYGNITKSIRDYPDFTIFFRGGNLQTSPIGNSSDWFFEGQT